MQPVELFTLQPVEGDALLSRLICGGRDHGKVNGRVLEGQFQCERGYVLLTSDGNAFEEVAHIYLLGADCQTVDVVSLGAMYHSGHIRDLVPCGDDCLEFSFFGGSDRWRLTILKKPKMRLLPSVASSIRYPNGWLRPHYLELVRV
jgi:hypothetical protein